MMNLTAIACAPSSARHTHAARRGDTPVAVRSGSTPTS